MSVKVKRKKNVNYYKRLERANKQETLVGFFSDSGVHPNSKDGYTITQLAIIHEYGHVGAGIPARPFMQTAYKNNRNEIKKSTAKLYADAIMGKIGVPTAGKRVGVIVKRHIKKTMREGKTHFEALSENYKKRPSGAKVTKSSIPLIDSGEMLKAVDSRVTKG